MMGISKRELLDDYYPDELAAVFEAWCDMHGLSAKGNEEQVSVNAFLDI